MILALKYLNPIFDFENRIFFNKIYICRICFMQNDFSCTFALFLKRYEHSKNTSEI